MRVFLLVLVVFLFKAAASAESSSEDGDNYEPPKKKTKSSCYFSKPVDPSPLEKFPRDNRYKVSTKCSTTKLHPMIELAENFNGKMYGADSELTLLMGRSEATYLDEYSDLRPWEDEVICDRHLRELSREFFNEEFGHLKKMRDSGGRDYACGYPEEHSAKGVHSMSHQMSKNLLHSHHIFVPAGAPLCDRHYRAIPKKNQSPRCSQDLNPLPSSSGSDSGSVIDIPPASQTVANSDGDSSSQESQSNEKDDSDYCPVGGGSEESNQSRKKMKHLLEELLKETKIERAFCRKPIGDLTDKNLRTKSRTVVEIMEIIVGLLGRTQEDYDMLMADTIKLLTGLSEFEDNQLLHSMMSAVAETFNKLVERAHKLQLLSVFAHRIKYHEIVKYIPNLSEGMWRDAKMKAMSPKRTLPDITRRRPFDPVAVELFISFVTSSHVMVGLPWGSMKTTDSEGNVISLPNTIRLTGIYETIDMYETWARQLGHE